MILSMKNIKDLEKKAKKKKLSKAEEKLLYALRETYYQKAVKESQNNQREERKLIPLTDQVKLTWKVDKPHGYKESFGEKLIRVFLFRNKIMYKQEVVFTDLPDLRFDFYLPKLKTCIEFDGEQHYKYVDKFDKGDFTKLDIRKSNDNRKNLFCERVGLTLLRIPYFKVEKLEKFLYVKLVLNK